MKRTGQISPTLTFRLRAKGSERSLMGRGEKYSRQRAQRKGGHTDSQELVCRSHRDARGALAGEQEPLGNSTSLERRPRLRLPSLCGPR